MHFRRRSILTLITVCTFISLVAFAADKQKKYSVATIQSVEKMPAAEKAQAGGSDAGLAADADTYRITADLDGKKYVVNYDTFADPEHDLNWLAGKKYEAYVQGRTLHIKSRTGRKMRLPIVSSTQ